MANHISAGPRLRTGMRRVSRRGNVNLFVHVHHAVYAAMQERAHEAGETMGKFTERALRNELRRLGVEVSL